jgi:transcriptional regulator with XRE-family HTH domain
VIKSGGVREQRGCSQKKLADMMDINRSTISKTENSVNDRLPGAVLHFFGL